MSGLSSRRRRITVRSLYLLLRSPPTRKGILRGWTVPSPFLPGPLEWRPLVPDSAASRYAASTSSSGRPQLTRAFPRRNSAFAVSTNPSGVAASRPAAAASRYAVLYLFLRLPSPTREGIPKVGTALCRQFLASPLVWRPLVPAAAASRYAASTSSGSRPQPHKSDPEVVQRPRGSYQPLRCGGLSSRRCRITVRGLDLLWIPPPIRARTIPRLDSALALSANPFGMAASRPAAAASRYVVSISCCGRPQLTRAFPRLDSAPLFLPTPPVWRPLVPPPLRHGTRSLSPAAVAPNSQERSRS